MKTNGLGFARGSLLILVHALVLLACKETLPSEAATGSDSQCHDLRFGWNEFGLQSGAVDRLPRGPEAIALGPNGSVLVLDAVHRRVLRIDAEGGLETIATIAPDSVDLAAGPDGAFATFSRLNARAAIADPDGMALGEVALPREFRGIVGIELGESRRLSFHNAHQETFTVGSPSAPLDLPSIQHSKLEGSFITGDGTGVLVRVSGGAAEVLLVENRRAEPLPRVDAPNGVVAELDGTFEASNEMPRESELTRAFRLPGAATAAQVIGLAGHVACFRIETVDPAANVVMVDRRLACMDLSNGQLTFEHPLQEPGIYLPPREVALGGSPRRLAWLAPEEEGLRITQCDVSSKEVAQ